MNTSIISTLNDKQAKLTDALNACTDEKAFDQINSELQTVTKTLILESNREKARIEAEEKAKRKKALDHFERESKRISSELEKANEMDKVIFNKMEDLYYTFMRGFAQREQAAVDNGKLQLTARELEIDSPASIWVTMCGTRPGTSGRAEDFFVNFVQQYDMAARALKDAKKNKVPGAPDRPGIDWFHKGMGQFFPCDPEPPIPPKENYSRKAGKNGQTQGKAN